MSSRVNLALGLVFALFVFAANAADHNGLENATAGNESNATITAIFGSIEASANENYTISLESTMEAAENGSLESNILSNESSEPVYGSEVVNESQVNESAVNAANAQDNFTTDNSTINDFVVISGNININSSSSVIAESVSNTESQTQASEENAGRAATASFGVYLQIV